MSLTPNTFLIGVQKSATTSLYDWIAQHPDVCGPISTKDTPFFIDDKLYSKGFSFLESIYSKYYENQKVIINGSAHTIYFEKALKRLSNYNPEAKIILVLRNPVERAISAYNFAVKRNLDDKDLLSAIDEEHLRLKSDDVQILSETTCIDHGRYFKQISLLRNYFKEENTLILFYKDVKHNPEQVIKETYSFLNLDPQFNPELKALNKTGTVRFKLIKNLVYNNNPVKKFLLKNVFDVIIPYDLKYRIKISILRLITKKDTKATKEQPKNVIDNQTKRYLYKLLEEDINNLEILLNKDLSHWKLFK
jgi:hypothetical protein